jgi:hypothetical protein
MLDVTERANRDKLTLSRFRSSFLSAPRASATGLVCVGDFSQLAHRDSVAGGVRTEIDRFVEPRALPAFARAYGFRSAFLQGRLSDDTCVN